MFEHTDEDLEVIIDDQLSRLEHLFYSGFASETPDVLQSLVYQLTDLVRYVIVFSLNNSVFGSALLLRVQRLVSSISDLWNTRLREFLYSLIFSAIAEVVNVSYLVKARNQEGASIHGEQGCPV